MTDTTDIKALRDQPDHDPYALVMAQNEALTKGIVVLQSQLEAERQRADKTEAKYTEVSGWYAKMKTRMLKAEAEIAALKGDQVPVALVDERQGSGGFCLTQHGRRLNLQHGTELFTAPQKPVVPVGFLFVVKATGAVIYSIADAAIEGTQLIGQIYGDAAIEAAGGIVKDGE